MPGRVYLCLHAQNVQGYLNTNAWFSYVSPLHIIENFGWKPPICRNSIQRSLHVTSEYKPSTLSYNIFFTNFRENVFYIVYFQTVSG